MASMPPSAPPIMSSGASTPPEVPGTQRDRPDGRLHQQDSDDDGAGHVALQQRSDGVVANAQRLRKDQSAQADRQRRRCTGHHIQWMGSLRKTSSARIDRQGQQRGQRPRQHAGHETARAVLAGR